MSTLTLTPLGKSVAEDTQGRGPEYAVLSLLYEASGPVDIEEVMDATRADDEKSLMIINRLIGRGLVRELQ